MEHLMETNDPRGMETDRSGGESGRSRGRERGSATFSCPRGPIGMDDDEGRTQRDKSTRTLHRGAIGAGPGNPRNRSPFHVCLTSLRHPREEVCGVCGSSTAPRSRQRMVHRSAPVAADGHCVGQAGGC